MKPLVLHDIADAVEMHESTISRVTTQKYMLTPRGVFELKYFFSSHVGTADGGAASSTAIRAIIKKLISEENPRKPLSDSKLATLLEEEGVNVARRTIAKYREALNIPPSNERKRLV
jgi:RNA polymerase sigma-54 factor